MFAARVPAQAPSGDVIEITSGINSHCPVGMFSVLVLKRSYRTAPLVVHVDIHVCSVRSMILESGVILSGVVSMASTYCLIPTY